MIETKVICDNCKADRAYEVSFDIGRTVDASGNNATKCLRAELCHRCHISILTKIIEIHIRDFQIELSLREIKGLKGGHLEDFPLFSESVY